MARDFDGTSSHISFTKSAAATDLSTVSYSYWVLPPSGITGFREVFWNGESYPNTYHSFVQHDNDNANYGFGANWTTAEAKWKVPRGTMGVWQHHLITYDFGSSANNPVWYINGVSQTVSTIVAPTGSADFAKDAGTLNLGSYFDGSAEFWLGGVAEFAMYNKILVQADATNLAAGYAPSFYPDGLVFYAMLTGANTPEYDAVGKTFGTVTSSARIAHPDFMRYPGTPKNRVGRPRPFAPGIAR